MRRPASLTQQVSEQTVLSVSMPIRASIRQAQCDCHGDDLRVLTNAICKELGSISKSIFPKHGLSTHICISDGVAHARLELDDCVSQDLPGVGAPTARDLQSSILTALQDLHGGLPDAHQGQIVSALARLQSRLPASAEMRVGEVEVEVDSSLIADAKAVQALEPETICGRINSWSYLHRGEQGVLGEDHPVGRIEVITNQFRRTGPLLIAVPKKYKKTIIKWMDEERNVTLEVALARLMESGDVAAGGHLLVNIID